VIKVKELIEENLERKIIYECELINDVESNRRARLSQVTLTCIILNYIESRIVMLF